MVNYEYECTSCGHHFELFQSINDQPLSECPECGRKIHRLISGGSSIIFKGSGFYVNDYKKSNKDTNRCCDIGQSCDHPKRCCDK